MIRKPKPPPPVNDWLQARADQLGELLVKELTANYPEWEWQAKVSIEATQRVRP